jgi:hypothetical protein
LCAESVKAKYEHASSYYSFGWSHGKEKLEGKPDTAKGSYYANPVHDRPVSLCCADLATTSDCGYYVPVDDESIIAKYPAFCSPNIWPTKEDCEGFESAFKNLAHLMVREVM